MRNERAFCSNCGADLTGFEPRRFRNRKPCPDCGSLDRQFTFDLDVGPAVHAEVGSTLPAFTQAATVQVATVEAKTVIPTPTISIPESIAQAVESVLKGVAVHEATLRVVMTSPADAGQGYVVSINNPTGPSMGPVSCTTIEEAADAARSYVQDLLE
jgi:hypothetical protein